MTQTTISELADLLAAALGMAPRALSYIIEDLGRAEMIDGIDEPATVEDAAQILVAAVGDFDVRAPWCAVRSFWNLPFVSLQMMTEAEGTISWETLQADDPYPAAVREFYGDTFGECLVRVIADLMWLNAPAIPGNVAFSSSPGRTCASIRLEITDRFDMLWFDRSTDDADGPAQHGLPPASPLRTVEIPAAIFGVLCNALEGAAHPWVESWANEHADQALEAEQKNWRN